ncbi:MAG: hypothetical protein JWP67_2946, partial [Mucilaginibacter sp.]|nr:hypothetical protein [Mucilaginibacter sp.]
MSLRGTKQFPIDNYACKAFMHSS